MSLIDEGTFLAELEYLATERRPSPSCVRRRGQLGGSLKDAARRVRDLGSVRMSGFNFDAEESFELALHRAAEAQNEAGHDFLAVITAQAAVEAVAQSVFT